MPGRRRAPAQASLIGRDAELEQLQAALDDVIGGEGRLVLLSGEPGIGKTRLAEELAAMASAEGAVVAWGRVDDAEGAPPYWPWAQVLQAVLAQVGHVAAVAALDGVAGPISVVLPEVKDLVADVEPPPALDAAAARFRLSSAVFEFLRRVSRTRSLVVVLDDLHWADAASLELTRFVASRLTAAALLLVGTFRSVDAGGSQSFDDALAVLARQPTLERMSLDGLSEQEIGRFMAQTIGVRSRAAAVAGVHARTEGNPFFAGELVRLLLSEGLLADPGQAAVPVGVRDVVRRRLVRLPEPVRRVLELGAVVGREFDLATVATEDDLTGDVVDALEPALAAGLITEAPGATSRFRFSHALVRDTIYGELSNLRRASLHARIGAVLERRGGPEGAHLAELASHFSHAAPVLGPEPGLTYALAAAAAAQASLAFEQAEDGLRRALDLVQMLAGPGERLERELDVQNRLASLLLMTRGQGAPEFGRACARARELCQSIGATDDLFKVMFNLSLFHVTSGEYRLLGELGAQLLAVGEQQDSTAWLLTGHYSVGSARLHAGDLGAALESMRAIERLARTLDPSSPLAEMFGEHPLVISLSLCGLVAWLVGDETGGRALHDEAVAVARTLDHPFTLADALYSRNKVTVLEGDAALALIEADEALAVCDDHGFGMFEAWLRVHRGWALCGLGRCEEGLRDLVAGVAANRAGGGRMNTAFFLGLLADGHAQRGDASQALSLIDEALEMTRASQEKMYEADLHRRRGQILAGRGPEHREAAADSLRKAVAVAEAQGAAPFRRRAGVALEALLGPAVEPGPPVLATAVTDAASSTLSRRECELLGLLAAGRTDKEIAQELLISLKTVHSHLDRIRDKTGRRRRPELTRLALELGIVPD